jgi:hypothetical protein
MEAVMRKSMLVALAVLLTTTTVVEARPSTLTMSCAQAAATVARAGAVVLTTGAHTYERFVASNSFCVSEEYAEAARAPTLDSPDCAVGYVCRHRQMDSDSN